MLHMIWSMATRTNNWRSRLYTKNCWTFEKKSLKNNPIHPDKGWIPGHQKLISRLFKDKTGYSVTVLLPDAVFNPIPHGGFCLSHLVMENILYYIMPIKLHFQCWKLNLNSEAQSIQYFKHILQKRRKKFVKFHSYCTFSACTGINLPQTSQNWINFPYRKAVSIQRAKGLRLHFLTSDLITKYWLNDKKGTLPCKLWSYGLLVQPFGFSLYQFYHKFHLCFDN